ncbi:MAG: GNAT family N-acetyltransferase [Nocardioides sp.]
MTPDTPDLPWPVRTERLTLRRARPEDLPAIGAYRVLPAVNEWLPTAPLTPEEHVAHISGKSDGMERTFVIEHDGTVIGDLYLAVQDAWGQVEVAERTNEVQAEVGWCLDPAYQGRGYASEAVAGLLRVCFVDLGLRRVVANSFAGNTASWRLMERLGMRREVYNVRDSLHRSGEWLDGVGYALLAEEWRDRNRADGR